MSQKKCRRKVSALPALASWLLTKAEMITVSLDQDLAAFSTLISMMLSYQRPLDRNMGHRAQLTTLNWEEGQNRT